MSVKVAVFIDGGYLRKINSLKIDLEKLTSSMIGSNILHRAYYYDCLPYMPANPSGEDRKRYAKAMKFHQKLNSFSRFCVREGKLRLKGFDKNNQPLFEQKRVDLMLGLDIASVAKSQSRIVDQIYLLAGDGDMLPAVLAAKEAQVIVCLAHGDKNTYDQELWDQSDERIHLDQAFFSSIPYNEQK